MALREKGGTKRALGGGVEEKPGEVGWRVVVVSQEQSPNFSSRWRLGCDNNNWGYLLRASCGSGSFTRTLGLISFNRCVIQVSKLRLRERKCLAAILIARWNLHINLHLPDSWACLSDGESLQALALNSFVSEGSKLWSGNWGLTDLQRRSCISCVFENGVKDFHCSGSVVGKSIGLRGEHSWDSVLRCDGGSSSLCYFLPHLGSDTLL